MNLFIFLLLPVSIFCIHEIDPTLTDAEKDRNKRSSIQCNSHSYNLNEFNNGMQIFNTDIMFLPTDELKKKSEAMKVLNRKTKVIDCASRCFFERTSNEIINAGCTDEFPGASAQDVFPKMFYEPIRYVCNMSMCNVFVRISAEASNDWIDERFLSNFLRRDAANKHALEVLETGEARSEPDTNLKCAKFKNHFPEVQSTSYEFHEPSENSTEIDCKAYCFFRNIKENGGVTMEGGCMEGRLSKSFLENAEKEYLCDRRMCNTGLQLFITGMRERIESDGSMKEVYNTILREYIKNNQWMIGLYYAHHSMMCFKYDVVPTKLPRDSKSDLEILAGTIHALAKLKPEEVRCSEGCYTTEIIDGHIYAGCSEERDPSRQDFVCKQDGCNHPIKVVSTNLVKGYKKHEVIQLVKGMDDSIKFLKQVGNKALKMVHA